MPALFGELSADGQSIALVAPGADDWDVKLIAAGLDRLTAAWTTGRRADGSENPDVLVGRHANRGRVHRQRVRGGLASAAGAGRVDHG